MSLIQFTRNHTDHSTDKGYQFEFFCDRCGNGFMSEFKASAIGMAGSALRTVGNLFGGFLGNVGGSTYEMERAVQGTGHDSAFRAAIDEAQAEFQAVPQVHATGSAQHLLERQAHALLRVRPRYRNRTGQRPGADPGGPDEAEAAGAWTSPRA